MRAIERGENPAAPAPRGDAAEARRKRREAMAAEAAALQSAEAAEAAGEAPQTGADAGDAPAETAGEAAPIDDAPAGRAAGDTTGDEADQTTATDPVAGDEPADGGTGEAAAGSDAPGGRGVSGAGRETADAGHTGGDESSQEAAAGGPGTAAAGRAAGGHVPARRAAAGEAGGGRGRQRVEPVDAGALAAVRGVLEEGGAPGGLGEAAVRLLGERAAEVLRGDPWLVLGLSGARVESADAFARALLGPECGPGDPRRAAALIGWLLERAAEQGHTALPSATLQAALARHAVPDPGAAVTTAVTDGQVLVFRDGDDTDGDADEDDETASDVPLLLGLDRYALAEESLADGLIRLLKSFEDQDADWEEAAAAAPSPSAAELIRAAARSGLVAHTGGEAARAEPAALVAAARAAGLRAYAAAATADGRRRLAAELGEEAAVTVEALLSGAEGPGHAPDGSLALDLLAVLDAPQLGVEDAATLVEAVPDGARLVLSGDEHTLWSVGPGRAFADLLAAKTCPRVSSRTPDPGPIGELVSGIGIGELAAVEAPDKEVVVVPVRDPREAVHRTVQLVADSVPRAIGVPSDRTQVITPGHGGAVGTRVLNAALKERLNPGPGRFGGFDPGDRVVHVPVPGRTLPGTVVGAEPDGLRLECEDGPVLVPRDDVAATVRHGWAITGHQAAGRRWPAVVVVVPGDAGPLLDRSWVYTAFARGERHLSVVQGADQALSQAVAGPPAKERTTRLRSVLRELAAEQ
ncbi:AAA family ATPase [Streptomyces sp. NPDC051976]|uniref:AAA family ATPase n=1 Tax=Streptomyces sp. NPDC051976 TaxID=3154947 RepID=UPI003417A5E8